MSPVAKRGADVTRYLRLEVLRALGALVVSLGS